MNLGVFLAIGESLTDLAKKGQLKRLTDYNIRAYSRAFDKVYIFSYANEKNFLLPKNCYLIPNTSGLHRYLYSIILPIIKREKIVSCDVLRGLQLSGGIPASIAKMIFRKKIVINYGYDYSKFAKIEGKIFQSFLYKLIQKPILALTDTVIVTSIEIKKQLEKIIDKSKIIYIPNGVDLNLFRSIDKKPTSGILNVLYIGRLEKQKNLTNLIEAIAMGKDSHKLTFFGQGSQKKELVRLANKLKVPLVIKKPIDYMKLPEILSKADIFVLPSLEEGSPKSLLEAMACALPVIGTNVKGINELVKNGGNGILVETDAQSIAKGIERFLDFRLRKKMGKNARKYIEKNFDIERLLEKELSILKDLTDESR